MKLLLIFAIAAFGVLVITTSKLGKPDQSAQAPSPVKRLLDQIPRPAQLTTDLAGARREPAQAAPSASILPIPAQHREPVPTEPTRANIERGYQKVITHDAGTRIEETLPIVQGQSGPRAVLEQPHFRVIVEDTHDQPTERKPTPQERACMQQAATGHFTPLECQR